MDRGQVTIFANLGKEAVSFDTTADHKLILASNTQTLIAETKVTVPALGLVIVSAELD